MNNNLNKLIKSITLKYSISLSLIAILSTVAFYMLHQVLQASSHTGYVVNISGKQRMLSQHIALDIHRVHHNSGEHIEKPFDKNEQEIVILLAHTKEMLHANTVLSTGVLEDGSKLELSPTIKELYFGELNVAQRVKEYISIANKVVKSSNTKDIDDYIQMIDSKSEALLTDLNKIVQQYQLEGEANLKYLQLLETIAWIATIIMLLLVVIFIFQPMVQQIIFSHTEKENILQHLEATVELKTLNLKNANDKLNHLAFHDSLTGLKNRLNLEKDIQVAIDKNKQHNAPYGALMFDIDWFKAVNDTYGHDVGDKVLIELSEILRSSVREEDKVYRAGGEEFVVLLNRISYKDITNVAEKIRLTIEKHIFKVADEEFSKTISGGLFHSDLLNAPDVKSVLKLIDNALYDSKTNGRNRITEATQLENTVKEENISPNIKIIFSDRTLTHILDIEHNENASLNCDKKQLLMQEKFFIEFVHPVDYEILMNIPAGITKEKPYISTVRMLSKDKKVSIYRLKAYKETNSFVLILEESVNIANGISDATHVQNLQSMLENTNDFIYFKDRNHVFTGASKTLVDLTSVDTREELIGKIDYDVFEKDLADEYFTLERKVFDGKLSVAQEIQHTVDNDGNKGYIDNRKYPMHDETGKIIGLFGVARVMKDEDV